jgi:signal peptidase I
MAKKILNVGYWVFMGFIGAIALLLIVSIFPITGNFKVMVVLSGSMEPTIKTGSLVVAMPSQDYKIGDIITFGPYSKTKSPTTHRIQDIKISSGSPVYITKGDANNAPDQKEVLKKDIIGKVGLDIPYLGYFVDFAKKPAGFALLIIVPALIIIFDEAKKIISEMKKIKDAKKNS